MDIYKNSAGTITLDINRAITYDEVDTVIQEIKQRVESIRKANEPKYYLGNADTKSWIIRKLGGSIELVLPTMYKNKDRIWFGVDSEVGKAMYKALIEEFAS